MYSQIIHKFVVLLFCVPLFSEGLPLEEKTSWRLMPDNAVQKASLRYEDITCWTCTNKTDNEACNNWAPEVRCPNRHSVCKSVHRFDVVTMETVYVTKTCSLPSKCSINDVGCRGVAGTESQCTACCSESYCNEDIPYDDVSAFRLSLTSQSSASFGVRQTSQLLTVLFLSSIRFSMLFSLK